VLVHVSILIFIFAAHGTHFFLICKQNILFVLDVIRIKNVTLSVRLRVPHAEA